MRKVPVGKMCSTCAVAFSCCHGRALYLLTAGHSDSLTAVFKSRVSWACLPLIFNSEWHTNNLRGFNSRLLLLTFFYEARIFICKETACIKNDVYIKKGGVELHSDIIIRSDWFPAQLLLILLWRDHYVNWKDRIALKWTVRMRAGTH